jgi:ribosome-binding factor A
MTRRTDQVGSLIQKELGELMLGIELPAMTTISRVEVSPDLKHAKVWVTIFSDDQGMDDQVMEALSANLYEMQGEINKKLVMHHAPRIAFAVDNSQRYASHINELLKKTHEDGNESE